jgi:hypothetical protein
MAKAAGRSGICLLAAVALAEASFLADNFLLIVAAFFALMAASGFFGYGILDAWHERRARAQLPLGPGQGHRGSGGRLPGEDATSTGFSPARIDGPRANRTRANRTRADGTRADSRARRPARGRRHPSRRGIPVPVRPLSHVAYSTGRAS